MNSTGKASRSHGEGSFLGIDFANVDPFFQHVYLARVLISHGSMFCLLEEDNGDKFSPTKSGNSGDSRASQLASGKYIAPIAQITHLDHWIDEKPLQNSPYGAANHKHYVRIYSGIGGATSTRTNTSAVTPSSIGNWRNDWVRLAIFALPHHESGFKTAHLCLEMLKLQIAWI